MLPSKDIFAKSDAFIQSYRYFRNPTNHFLLKLLKKGNPGDIRDSRFAKISTSKHLSSDIQFFFGKLSIRCTFQSKGRFQNP